MYRVEGGVGEQQSRLRKGHEERLGRGDDDEFAVEMEIAEVMEEEEKATTTRMGDEGACAKCKSAEPSFSGPSEA